MFAWAVRLPFHFVLLLSALLFGACAGTAELTPRQSVVRVLEVGIGTANPDAIRPLIGPTYTQHNPRVVDGPEGLLGFVAKFKERPASARPKVKVIRTIVDGDFVVAHTQYKRRGWLAAFDMFRVADGKLVEHWDAGQSEPASTISGHSMLDGPTEIVDRERTEQNKALVLFFAHEVLMKRNLAIIAAYFEGDAYIEHEPTRGDGVAALGASLSTGPAASPTTLVHEEARRVFGE